MTFVTGAAEGCTNLLTSSVLSVWTHAAITVATATQFKLVATDTYGNHYTVSMGGTDFAYAGSKPTAGTLTSIVITDWKATTHQIWSAFSLPLATVWNAVKTGNVSTLDSLLFGGVDDFVSHATGGHQNRFFGYNGNDIFEMQITAGNDQLNGGPGDDSINFSAGFSAQEQIDGGTGTDTLYLDGDYSGGVTFASTTMRNVEYLIPLPGHNYRLTTADATVAAGQTLNVNSSPLGSGNWLYFDGTAETDGTFLVLCGSGNDTVLGGRGNDVIYGYGGNDLIVGGGGADVIDCGSGDDTVEFLAGVALNPLCIIDGGTGNNTLQLDGDYSGAHALVLNATTVRNFSTLALFTGHSYNLTTNNATVASGAQLEVACLSFTSSNTLTFNGVAETNGSFRVDCGSGNDSITGGSGADILYGNGGNDVLNGGGGNDTLNPGTGTDRISGGNGDDTIEMGASLTAADAIDGGAGSDALNLNGNYSAGVTFGPATVTNVETIGVAAGYSYALTTNDATVAAGATLTVSALTLAATNTLRFTGSAESNGQFALAGGSGNDVLTGGHGDDRIAGNAGADTITGGQGADRLIGGTGADRFSYGAASDSTSTRHDAILDFDAAVDKIDTWFTVTGINTALTTGALNSGTNFDANLTTAIGSHLAAHHAILFKPNSGSLSGTQFLIIDANGIAGYQAGADLVIELATPAHLSSLGVGTFT